MSTDKVKRVVRTILGTNNFCQVCTFTNQEMMELTDHFTGRASDKENLRKLSDTIYNYKSVGWLSRAEAPLTDEDQQTLEALEEAEAVLASITCALALRNVTCSHR